MPTPHNARESKNGDYVCLYCEGRERYCNHCDSSGLVSKAVYDKQRLECQAAYSRMLADRDYARRRAHGSYAYGYEWARAYGEI